MSDAHANYEESNELLINDGIGNFISTLTDRADWSSGATAGDWNGDGMMDIFVVNSEGFWNEILINDGVGNFISTLTDRTRALLTSFLPSKSTSLTRQSSPSTGTRGHASLSSQLLRMLDYYVNFDWCRKVPLLHACRCSGMCR